MALATRCERWIQAIFILNRNVRSIIVGCFLDFEVNVMRNDPFLIVRLMLGNFGLFAKALQPPLRELMVDDSERRRPPDSVYDRPLNPLTLWSLLFFCDAFFFFLSLPRLLMMGWWGDFSILLTSAHQRASLFASIYIATDCVRIHVRWTLANHQRWSSRPFFSFSLFFLLTLFFGALRLAENAG